MKLFRIIPNVIGRNHNVNKSDLLIKADDRPEAYYLFLEMCLGIRLSSYQKEDVLKNLVGERNPLFPLVECEEVLP